MRKFLLPLIALLLCSGNLFSTHAQQPRVQEREVEWQSYVLPKTNFARKTDPDKNVVFRVPADWQQEGESLNFKGPHESSLKILIQKIPEGYPLDDLFGATLQVVKDRLGNSDELIIRRTQLQDIEAREMVFESQQSDGELLRSIAWCAIYGPHVYWFNLQTPGGHAAELEPYFKALLQSVTFAVREPRFEELRTAAFKTATPTPIDETENLADSL